MFPPTAGDARVNDLWITTDMPLIRKIWESTENFLFCVNFSMKFHTKSDIFHIGFCPQHDILWDLLTITEHLHLYAKM